MGLEKYELIGEWKNSNSGKIITAKKSGNTYFIKKYQTPVEPIDNGSLQPKTIEKNRKIFREFVDVRKRINETIRTITGPGGNIIIPCEEFVEGNHYVEVTDYIEGVVTKDDIEKVLSGLSVEKKILLMCTAAGALSSVHSKHIVHSDLKLDNVLLVKNKIGNYVAKLIDFDNSYFVDKKPEEVIGTIDYYSPELGIYSNAEDERDELGKRLTEKSDIFSLGLILHYYLSGEFPTPIKLTDKLKKRQEKGKRIYCWVALNNGCELQLSTKIKDESHIQLIRDMLSKEPEDRPTANDVLLRLKTRTKDIEEKKTTETKKVIPSPVKKVSGFCEPWDTHPFVFDTELIQKKGFSAAERAERAGVKGYNLYRSSDAQAMYFTIEKLKMLKYVKEKGATKTSATSVVKEAGIGVPWPEHNIVFDEDMIRKKGFIGIKQDEANGIKGYRAQMSDGTSRFIRLETVLLQKMAKKV